MLRSLGGLPRELPLAGRGPPGVQLQVQFSLRLPFPPGDTGSRGPQPLTSLPEAAVASAAVPLQPEAVIGV